MSAQSPSSPSGSSGSDPAALETILFACLDEAPAQQEAALLAACARHPAMAESLRRCWQRIRQLQPANGLPAQVAGHRILARLGGGGMGVVYLAEQERLHRKVALKLIRSDLLDSPAARERFQREAQAASKVDHPGLCPVFEVGEADGVPFLVMPFLEGRTLAVRLAELAAARGPSASSTRSMSSASRDLVSVVAAVARAAHHAHEHGLVHRDIKPGNIMLLTDGRPMLLDFGLARDTSGDEATLTRTGERVGTPAYMAPEQLRGEAAAIDRRTDVYALGIVLYEVALLERPFDGGDMLLLREQIASGIRPAKLRARVPFDLASIILKAADPEPARRYATAAALAEDLERFLRLEPVSARRLGWTGRVVRWVRRHPVVSALLGALLVALGFAGGAAVAATQSALAEQAKNREFDLLSGVVKYDLTMKAEKKLYPPWPHKIAAMQEWLRNDCGQLLAMKPEIERTLRDLQARSTQLSEAAREAERRSSPQFAAWEQASKRVAWLHHSRDVRDGKIALVVPELPTSAAGLSAQELQFMAWERVSPKPIERVVEGEEPLGLTYALAAVAKAVSTGAEHEALETLAYALVANGQHQEARDRMLEALGKAPANEQRAYRTFQSNIDMLVAVFDKETEARERVLAQSTAELAAVRTCVVDGATARFLEANLGDLLQKFVGLEKVKTEVERRLAWAQRIRQLTFENPAASFTWSQARAAIAKADGNVASSAYRGRPIDLSDENVIGLVPIGMNPDSKLWEFYDLWSAWDGNGDPAAIAIPRYENGRLEVTEDTGVVFVLLPGGPFLMGAQARSEDAPNYDDSSPLGEGPPVEVTLAPFFLSKYEMTIGQWSRLWTRDEELKLPAAYPIGHDVGGKPLTKQNPVENVDWTTCMELALMSGFLLPTEAQWEFGCRGGTETKWFCAAEELQFCANLADATTEGRGETGGVEAWSDGYILTAPVGQFRANPFGLHDVYGNVWEWCLEEYGITPVRPREGDGLRLRTDDTHMKCFRGGSFRRPSIYARSAMRGSASPSQRGDEVGFRPARALRSPE